MLRALIAVIAFLVAGVTPAHADSWPGPVEAGVASPDGRIVVRIIPGESLGEVYGFSSAKKGAHARAKYYRLSDADEYLKYQNVELKNPIAPVFFAVASSGALVTLDNWHNMGYGDAITIYSGSGEVVKTYTLSDLYSPGEIEKFPASVSSIWWRCSGKPVLNAFNSKLAIYDVLKQIIEVDLETGAIAVAGQHAGCDDAT